MWLGSEGFESTRRERISAGNPGRRTGLNMVGLAGTRNATGSVFGGARWFFRRVGLD